MNKIFITSKNLTIALSPIQIEIVICLYSFFISHLSNFKKNNTLLKSMFFILFLEYFIEKTRDRKESTY